MSPDTVHLLAQLIRHQKGVLTALEKWVARQPACRTNLELSGMTALMLDVLTAYETALSRVDVDEPGAEKTELLKE